MKLKYSDDQINTEDDRKISGGLNWANKDDWAKMTAVHGGKVMPPKMPRYVDLREMNKWVSTKVVDACEFIPGYDTKWPVDILRSGSQYYRTTSKGPEYIKPGDFIVRAFGDHYKFVDRDIFLKGHELAEGNYE